MKLVKTKKKINYHLKYELMYQMNLFLSQCRNRIKPDAWFNKKFLLIFLFVLMATLNLLGQASKVWDYPVHYGTQEWAELKTFEERLNVLNVPDSLLQIMTTEDLVKTCLAYPDWMLITSRDNLQTGYNFIRSVFNGFRELEQRPDACKELVKVYQKMNPEEITGFSTLVKQGEFCFQFSFIEILISQWGILVNSTESDLKRLLKISLTNYEKKNNAIKEYALFGLSTTCLIPGRILEQRKTTTSEKLKVSSPKFKQFIDECSIPDKELLDQIIIATKEYLTQLES